MSIVNFAERQKLTPPQLARLWGIDPHKIIQLDRRGELQPSTLPPILAAVRGI